MKIAYIPTATVGYPLTPFAINTHEAIVVLVLGKVTLPTCSVPVAQS